MIVRLVGVHSFEVCLQSGKLDGYIEIIVEQGTNFYNPLRTDGHFFFFFVRKCFTIENRTPYGGLYSEKRMLGMEQWNRFTLQTLFSTSHTVSDLFKYSMTSPILLCLAVYRQVTFLALSGIVSSFFLHLVSAAFVVQFFVACMRIISMSSLYQKFSTSRHFFSSFVRFL